MRFFIMVNLDKNHAEACSKAVISRLITLGGKVSMAEEDSKFMKDFSAVNLGKIEDLIPVHF